MQIYHKEQSSRISSCYPRHNRKPLLHIIKIVKCSKNIKLWSDIMRNSLRVIKTWLNGERTRNMTLSIRKKTTRLREPRWSRSVNKWKQRTASAMRKDWSKRQVDCTNSLMRLKLVKWRVCGACGHQARRIYGATTYRWINTRTWSAIKKFTANTRRNWLMVWSRKSRSISELRGSRNMLANNTCNHSRCLNIEFDLEQLKKQRSI